MQIKNLVVIDRKFKGLVYYHSFNVPKDLRAAFNNKTYIRTTLGNDKRTALIKHAELEKHYETQVALLRSRSKPNQSPIELLTSYSIPARPLSQSELDDFTELYDPTGAFEKLGDGLELNEFPKPYRQAVDLITGRRAPSLSSALELYKSTAVRKNINTYKAEKAVQTAIELLGDLELTELRRANVNSFYDLLIARGLRQTTVSGYISAVAKVIRSAIIEGDLLNVTNSFASFKIQATDKQDRQGLTKEIWQSVMNTPNDLTPIRSSLITTILATGARLSEICALRAGDVVIQDGKVTSIMVVWHEGRRLKNKNSTREVPICVESVATQLLELVKGKSKDAYLFPDYAINRNAASVYFNRWLKKKFAKEGDKSIIIIHGARHLMQTAMSNARVDIDLNRAVLGWSADAADMTAYYGSGVKIELKIEAMQKAINWLQQ